MSDQIIINSSEGTSFSTSIQIASISGFLNNIIQEFGNQSINIPISSLNLSRVLDYARHHNFTPPAPLTKPICHEDLAQNVNDPWDADFIKRLTEEELVDLLLTANYLDMKSLLELCNVAVAGLFKDKDIDYLKKKYNIQEDLTPEVEEMLKKEYPWALEVEKINTDE